ncbi:hypothetical protein D9619_005481 [Psilocybe cf. subviscida]|uniref:DNA breaking-rejoining enzyme n=1 Tax=Psilocybe cf. subviscida TaxID=2480587 RepID=A0A8H5FBI5_9AGAR|nr:hypothetical protein D9619_005481 [Psilocybe cf. subviscida]
METTTDISTAPGFAGLTSLLAIESRNLHLEDIEADIEGEKETLPDFVDTEQPGSSSSSATLSISQIEKTIAGYSKGVSDGTENEYHRLANACVAFLISRNLISTRDDFLSKSPPLNAPLLIVAWIMHDCDTVALDGFMATGPRHTYAHAQKMRASLTHVFGRDFGLGHTSWVATYMVSLRRRKVQEGEAATSARAITSTILEQLYDFNHLPENHDIGLYERRRASGELKQDPNHWGGPLARRAMHAIYTLAFLCLLRVDEVLNIKAEHVEFIDNGSRSILILTLPFRKTHQFGEIQPFFLQALAVEDAHLCPVRAVGEWIHASGITSGYLFRRMTALDRPVLADAHMSSQQCLELFRNNLLDIGIDPAPYGTHSFRRGGCQYLSSERRWLLRRICEWGGWSTEFSNLTIVKYLLSWNDNPTERREDFFNPDIQPTTKCYHCGRSCPCA